MNRRPILFALLLLSLCLVQGQPGLAQVNYRLTGMLEVVRHSSGTYPILRTGDGRLFNLTGMPLAKLTPFEGQNVVVEGSARQGDQLTDLKVNRIAAAPIDPQAVVLPPLKPHQTPVKLVSQRPPIYQLANVRWGYTPGQPRNNDNFRFVQATLDTSKVDRAYFVIKPFPPEWIAAHSLMYWSLKPGGLVSETGEQASGIFLSIEAYQRKDQSYSLIQGLKNTFGSAWIMGAWEDYTTQSCEVQNEKLFLYPLKLTQSQMSTLLAEAVLQATVNRTGEFYHTVTNNCTNNLIILLNRVLPAERRINLWTIPSMVYNLRATMPVIVPKMLMKKGLVGEPLPEVNARNFRQTFGFAAPTSR